MEVSVPPDPSFWFRVLKTGAYLFVIKSRVVFLLSEDFLIHRACSICSFVSPLSFFHEGKVKKGILPGIEQLGFWRPFLVQE